MLKKKKRNEMNQENISEFKNVFLECQEQNERRCTPKHIS